MATLARAISKVDSPIEVDSAVSVASAYPWRFTLDSEVVYVTGALGTLLSVQRGADDTEAASHAAGTTLTPAPIPTSSSSSSLSVVQGATLVANVAEINFTSGAVVTDAGGGEADVAITGTVPTLADVLAAGNDTGGTAIVTSDSDVVGGTADTIDLEAGRSEAGNLGAKVYIRGGDDDGGRGGGVEVKGGDAGVLGNSGGQTSIGAGQGVGPGDLRRRRTHPEWRRRFGQSRQSQYQHRQLQWQRRRCPDRRRRWQRDVAAADGRGRTPPPPTRRPRWTLPRPRCRR